MLGRDGSVRSHGWGADGQLGVPASTPTTAPVTIPPFDHIERIAAYSDASFAFSRNALYAWGNSEWGQLGLGNAHPRIATPTAVPAPRDVIDIAPGGSFTLLRTREHVYGVGHGCFGDPLHHHQPSTYLVPHRLHWRASVQHVAAGNAHAALVRLLRLAPHLSSKLTLAMHRKRRIGSSTCGGDCGRAGTAMTPFPAPSSLQQHLFTYRCQARL